MTQNQKAAAIGKALVAWFRRSRRDLPWRRTRDPYAIWVSEVMLQQTRVEAVGPYFARFLARFPDAASLAAASLDEVLKCWEGMGYYARARNLHAAARLVVGRHGGKLPRTADGLRKLPGVGRYTAGAIASIAFGLDEPVLDGNVTRVLCRLFRIRQDPRTAKVQKRLWALARQLIPPGRAGLGNQAMMDLGATVCVPRRPRCAVCPVASLCAARARGDQAKLPVRPAKKPLPHQTIAAGVVHRRGRVLIDRRHPEGLLGGLWEFPGGKVECGETPAAAVVREVREEVGIDVEVVSPLVTVRHAYTHFRITLHAFECRYLGGRTRAIGCAETQWVRPDELDRFAFPKANQRIIAALRDARSAG